MKPVCKHCRKRNGWKSRGLCWTCFRTPGVRDSYPPKGGEARRGSGVDCNGGYTLPPVPTLAQPGSPEKEAVLTERAAAGTSLWHPDDFKPN